MTKQSTSGKNLGVDTDTCKKWIEYQITTEMNW